MVAWGSALTSRRAFAHHATTNNVVDGGALGFPCEVFRPGLILSVHWTLL